MVIKCQGQRFPRQSRKVKTDQVEDAELGMAAPRGEAEVATPRVNESTAQAGQQHSNRVKHKP